MVGSLAGGGQMSLAPPAKANSINLRSNVSESPCLSKEQIVEFLRAHKQEFYDQYGIEKIGLFGSIVRGEMREGSDIDIAIEMVPAVKPCVIFSPSSANWKHFPPSRRSGN